jgi:hypothetical protein
MLDKTRLRIVWQEARQTLGLPADLQLYALKTLGNSFALARGCNVSAQAHKMGHRSTRMAQTAYRPSSLTSYERRSMCSTESEPLRDRARVFTKYGAYRWSTGLFWLDHVETRYPESKYGIGFAFHVGECVWDVPTIVADQKS